MMTYTDDDTNTDDDDLMGPGYGTEQVQMWR